MTKEAATNATVLEVLGKLDGAFAGMAKAFGNAEFALWVGSGISRRAPSLGGIIGRALEFLRQKAIGPDTHALFDPALRSALGHSGLAAAGAESYFGQPLAAWPPEVRDPFINGLWKNYSKLLNVRIEGTAEDYILWDAVDVREAFSNPPPPACEHLCIAILILEGALQQIASANWDGFIEAAVEQLAGGLPGNLQVVVDPGHLRDAPGKARLIKFHGCIVHAAQKPELYRQFLVGSTTQIANWPQVPLYAAIRSEVISLATNHKALMTGLSLQDDNLQAAFIAARQANPWQWPCDPQAHIFCEGEIGEGQRQMLQTVYAGSYNNAIADIESGALLQAWGEQVLLALVFKVLSAKFATMIELALEGRLLAADSAPLIAAVDRLRDSIAVQAVGDRTAFIETAIRHWSRAISLFRTGALPGREGYEVLSSGPVGGIAQDQNARIACFGELGVALSLLQQGVEDARWTLSLPVNDGPASGAMSGTGAWDGAVARPIFFARTAGVAIALQKSGAFANDNAIVIHADETWHLMQESSVGDSPRKVSRSPGRSGSMGTNHVSLARLLATETSAVGLAGRFVLDLSL
jgi:SIR2-like domain